MEGTPAGIVPSAGDNALVEADTVAELIRQAQELIASADADERAAGCELLGEASEQDDSARPRAVAALVALAARESEDAVLLALVRALEKTEDQRAVPVLVGLAGHRDAGIRREVAASFAGVLTGRPDGPDVDALITLSRDEDPDVRNWATFTLGAQTEADSPAIRAALWERTTDEHTEAREEGIRGLARRHDRRAVPLLAELLNAPEGASVLTLAAARTIGAPELLPALRDYDPADPGVADAMDACDPAWRAQLEAWAWRLAGELQRVRPDLDAAVAMDRFAPGLSISVATASGRADYAVQALRERAGGDAGQAAELVASDLPESEEPAESAESDETGE